MITALLVLALVASSSGEVREPIPVETTERTLETTERTPTWQFSVLVMGSRGEPAPGARVELCFWDSEERACDLDSPYRPYRRAITDSAGRARVAFVPQGEYGLRARFADYAETTIGPLGIGQVPLAPDEIVVLLNPICYNHCTVPRPQ